MQHMTHFNPLHHEGGDPESRTGACEQYISIHSTTRVETVRSVNTAKKGQFQSTPPRGWRHVNALGIIGPGTFQSTPPRGWRRFFIIISNCRRNFNPLHHEGGDTQALPSWHILSSISIHSTTRVETFGAFNLAFLIGISIHSTTRVETIQRAYHVCGTSEFQSTPPRGWRQQYYTITTTILQHISTNKSYPTPSNHGQPSLHTRKSVLIVQIFRCESPRKSMFASGSHQNTLYRFTARGQVRISAVLPH